MQYQKIVKGKFISRPNRFIAKVLIDGRVELCHVRNTGRCRELLLENTTVYLEDCEGKARKTRYSLVAVQKGRRLINIDSQAPNKVFAEALKSGKIRLPGISEITTLKAEKTFGDSRFDFYLESRERQAFIEIKGVTLEENGVVMFPDAPTDRGEKHVYELLKAMEEGYLAYLVFVIQMKDVIHFIPNDLTHPGFGEALRKAAAGGVQILAYECNVRPDCLKINGKECPIKLQKTK